MHIHLPFAISIDHISIDWPLAMAARNDDNSVLLIIASFCFACSHFLSNLMFRDGASTQPQFTRDFIGLKMIFTVFPRARNVFYLCPPIHTFVEGFWVTSEFNEFNIFRAATKLSRRFYRSLRYLLHCQPRPFFCSLASAPLEITLSENLIDLRQAEPSQRTKQEVHGRRSETKCNEKSIVISCESFRSFYFLSVFALQTNLKDFRFEQFTKMTTVQRAGNCRAVLAFQVLEIKVLPPRKMHQWAYVTPMNL